MPLTADLDDWRLALNWPAHDVSSHGVRQRDVGGRSPSYGKRSLCVRCTIWGILPLGCGRVSW